MKVKSESEVAQSCPTLNNPMDCLPDSSVHGIFQARVLDPPYFLPTQITPIVLIQSMKVSLTQYYFHLSNQQRQKGTIL